MLKPIIILSAVLFSSQAFAGPRCASFDINQDRVVNQQDLKTMQHAILFHAENDFDYNMDKAVNILDITAFQMDARIDIREYATDARACILGELDRNGDGVTNIRDVVLTKNKHDKWLTAQCASASEELDINGDGEVSVSDIVMYTSDVNAESDGFALAASVAITRNVRPLDMNGDKRINVLDAIMMQTAAKRCAR